MTTTDTTGASRSEFFDRLYAGSNTPEQVQWKTHRTAIRKHIRYNELGYRGCVGLALIMHDMQPESVVDAAKRVFLADAGLLWATLADVPVGSFTGPNREVRWATVRKTSQECGIPSIGATGWHTDFGNFPHDPKRVSINGRTMPLIPNADTLQPSEQPQLFKVFNEINLAMTTSALSFRNTWKHARRSILSLLGYPADQEFTFVLGDKIFSELASPRTWMPKAYIGVAADVAATLYKRTTRPGAQGEVHEPVYSEGLKEAFVSALSDKLAYYAPFDGVVASAEKQLHDGIKTLAVTLTGNRGEQHVFRVMEFATLFHKKVGETFSAGDKLVEARFSSTLPGNWQAMCYADKWKEAGHIVAGRLDHVIQTWFDREGLPLVNGFVHFPLTIVSNVAHAVAVTEMLMWDITTSLPYCSSLSDAMIFPPIGISAWWELEGDLPGGIHCNAKPADERFKDHMAAK